MKTSGILPFLPPVAPSSEGAASNAGGGGLEHQAWCKGRTPDCFAVVIRYPFKYYSPTYTVVPVPFASNDVRALVSELARRHACMLALCWQHGGVAAW